MRQRLTIRRLIALLGKEPALLLLDEHGGSRLPRLTAYDRERIERDEQIRRDVDEGETYAAVAERYGLAKTRVIQIASG